MALSWTFEITGRPGVHWWLLGLLLQFLLWTVALSYQWVQSHHSTKPLEPRPFWPLHLGFWHLLHIWPACWGGLFQPKTWLSHFSARLNQEYLGSCMHCWDISEFLFLPFFFCIFHRKNFYQGQSCVRGWVLRFQYLPSRQRSVLAWAGNGWVHFIQKIGKLVMQNGGSNVLPGRVGLSYAKFLPRDTEWEGSFEVIWSDHWAWKYTPTVTQVRKKTLLNKDEIACSEVTFVFPACFESRIPTTPSNLVSSPGSPKRQAVTWIGSGLLFFYSRINLTNAFWKLSDSTLNGFNSCSRIEDITNYQNALSKALLVSLSSFLIFHVPFPFSRHVG